METNKLRMILIMMFIGCLANEVICKPNKKPSTSVEEYSDYPGDEDDENYDDTDETPEENVPNPNSATPLLLSTEKQYDAKLGGEVNLECITKHTERIAVQWRKEGGSIISAETVIIDKLITNMQVYKNNTLRIQPVTEKDAGYYVCFFESPSGAKLEVKHRLDVLSPATITDIRLSSDRNEIRVNETLDIECRVSGYPRPKITWSKNGTSITGKSVDIERHDHEHGSTLRIHRVDRQHAGAYQCLADNRLGTPAHRAVVVVVQQEPEIIVHRHYVNTEVGYPAELDCVVHSYVKPDIKWMSEQRLNGEPSTNKSMSDHEHVVKAKLKFQTVEKEDLGTYTCVASNHLGRKQAKIVLTQRPEFRWQKSGFDEMGNEVLRWTVRSVAPLSKMEVHYSKDHHRDNMTVLEVAIKEPKMDNVYHFEQTLRGLSPGHYRAILKPYNTYGVADATENHIHKWTVKENILSQAQNIEGHAQEAESKSTGGALSAQGGVCLTNLVMMLVITFCLH